MGKIKTVRTFLIVTENKQHCRKSTENTAIVDILSIVAIPQVYKNSISKSNPMDAGELI